MPALRQVPSGLDPKLDGFLRDLRNSVHGILSGNWQGAASTTRKTDYLTNFGQMIGNRNAGANTPALPGAPVPFDPSQPPQRGENPVSDAYWAIYDWIINDPFFQFLGEQIQIIQGPPELPGSVQAQVDEAKRLLEAAMAEQGSAIIKLEQTTAEQASITVALGTRVGSAESTILTLSATTAQQAVQLNVLTTRTDKAESNIIEQQATTKDLAYKYTELDHKTADHETRIVAVKTVSDQAASDVLQLTTRYNNREADLEVWGRTLFDSKVGLTAQYSVKAQVPDPKTGELMVSGFGLAADQTNGSRFYVRADCFAVASAVDENAMIGNPEIPFIVLTAPKTINGVTYPPGTFIKDALIINLEAERIRSNSLARTQLFQLWAPSFQAGVWQTFAGGYYWFRCSPDRDVVLRIDIDIDMPIATLDVRFSIYDTNPPISFKVFYKNGQQLNSRNLYSSYIATVKVPASRGTAFNMAAVTGASGSGGEIKLFITEHLA